MNNKCPVSDPLGPQDFVPLGYTKPHSAHVHLTSRCSTKAHSMTVLIGLKIRASCVRHHGNAPTTNAQQQQQQDLSVRNCAKCSVCNLPFDPQ